MAKAHATGLPTPGPNTAVLPEVYGGLPGCVRRHFMAAITFFLVVNTTVEAQSRITAPRHSAPSNRVVTPLLVFSLHSGELPNCAPVTALHSRVTEQANGAATFQMTNSILCEVSL